MVPGYTGYIPKSEKYFGDRFAVICDHATNDIIGHTDRYRKSKVNQGWSLSDFEQVFLNIFDNQKFFN